MKKSHAGFTALELLVVIGIIGIIIALALVGLTRARAKSRDDSRISNMRLVQIALEDFKTACRNYPYSLDASADNCIFSNAEFGEFLNEIPVNPLGTEFKYYAYANPSDSSQCIGYHLALELETENHVAFASDDDFNSDTSAYVACDNAGQPFNGGPDDVTQLYDIHR